MQRLDGSAALMEYELIHPAFESFCPKISLVFVLLDRHICPCQQTDGQTGINLDRCQ